MSAGTNQLPLNDETLRGLKAVDPLVERAVAHILVCIEVVDPDDVPEEPEQKDRARLSQPARFGSVRQALEEGVCLWPCHALQRYR